MNKLDELELRDREKIEAIRKKWNLNNKKDIEEVLGLLQAGSFKFDTAVGRDFDDELFEKYQQIKNETNKSRINKNKINKNETKKNKINKTGNSKQTSVNYKAFLKREKRRRLVIYICIAVAVLSLGYFTVYCYQAYKSGQEFESLSSLKNSDFELYRPARMTVDEPGETPDILEDYQTLYAKNKSLIGWLKIDDTIIDYPVMQSSNEEYYLNHNFNQEKDNNGSLFIDAECSIWPRSQNIIIYGHNMKSGKMFGTLNQYKSEAYFEKHPAIQFDTLYETGEYQIMYVFSEIVHEQTEVTFRYYEFINANSKEEYDSNMEEMKKMSLYDTGVTSVYGDELITLSTCDYSAGAERFAVVAKKIR